MLLQVMAEADAGPGDVVGEQVMTIADADAGHGDGVGEQVEIEHG